MHRQTGCGGKTQRDALWKKTANKILSVSDTAPLSTWKQPFPGGRWGNALGVRGEAKMLSPPLASLDSFIEGEARVAYGYIGNWVHPHAEYPWWWKRMYGHAQLSWRKERHELGVWRREKSASFLDGMNFIFLFWRVKWLLNHAISFFPLFFVFFFLQLSFFFIVP